MERTRRLRKKETMRAMVRETILNKNDLIYPLMISHEKGLHREIKAMPGYYQIGVDLVVEEAERAAALGIPALILFGVPSHKDESGSPAWDDEGVVQQALQAIKAKLPELTLITDVCLCSYTSHGHCGLLKGETVDNDPTIELLGKMSVSHAQAGADMVAPSDMMDGRVEAIRDHLDGSGFADVPIMSYAAKYASAFYEPFRDAADSSPSFGDRRSYQMDPANSREAIREVEIDIAEGADIVMVKPALAYLDIIRDLRENFSVPLCAYNVSGEYSLVKAAVAQGLVTERKIVMEILTSIKRAGADTIITYHAPDVCKWLDEG